MRIVEVIEKRASARNIMAWFLVAIVTGAIMLLGIVPRVDAIIGEVGLLDTRLFYTFDEVTVLFGALGQEGFILYTYQKIVDMVFPLGYALPMAMIQALLNKRAFVDDTKAKNLIFLPLLGMLLDYAENILIATQIVSYPALSQPVVLMASIATLLKWVALGLSFICLLGVLLIWLLKRRSA